MANRNDARSTADARFEKARKTTEVAKSTIANEREATRKKTEQLRELRLAKAAAAGITETTTTKSPA